MWENKKAIVLGAGVAGLATAIRLAVQDFEVTVYEKNPHPGGKLSHFKLDGFCFDAGPSLFTQPENITELFTLANEPVEAYLTYEKINITCKYFFENGIVINAYSNPEKFAAELQEKTGENSQKVCSYLQHSKQVYNNIGKLFLEYPLHRIKSLSNAPLVEAIKATKAKLIFSTLHQLNQAHFNKPETVQLFDRFATYNGSNPYKAPGMLSLISHLELNEGVYYPAGGMKSISEALYKLAVKKGVQFCFNQPVQKIIHSNGRVEGVVVNDKDHRADVVISNVDVYFTYKYLLNDRIKAASLLKQERSSSAIIFYWGIGKAFPELELHNIFFSKDYKGEFDKIFSDGSVSDDPTIYINITSKMEKGQAPAGKENWFVMVNAPANKNQNWEELKKQCKKNVLKKLNRILKTTIESLIEVEETLDPVKIEEQTASFLGALYGTSSNSAFAAFLRHPNFNKNIRGLYFAGGTVHPGGGIPLCLKSAKMVSQLIKDDLKS